MSPCLLVSSSITLLEVATPQLSFQPLLLRVYSTNCPFKGGLHDLGRRSHLPPHLQCH